MDEEPIQIDIEKVVKAKFRRGKSLPRFVVNYLKRVIHQDELNRLFRDSDGFFGVEFATRIKTLLNIEYEIHGEENIPKTGRHIFVSNHPLGGVDGIILISYLGNLYSGKIRVQVNDLLMNVSPLSSVFIPVNSFGSQNRDLVGDIDALLNSDNQILVFPAGLCSRKNNGVIEDMEWKKWFVKSAVQYQRDVVPVYFDGKNSNFFYRLANLRKRLGIKFNIELIYLPGEMLKASGNKFGIYFGEPVPWQTFSSVRTAKEWAQDIKKQVYSLKNS